MPSYTITALCQKQEHLPFMPKPLLTWLFRFKGSPEEVDHHFCVADGLVVRGRVGDGLVVRSRVGSLPLSNQKPHA